MVLHASLFLLASSLSLVSSAGENELFMFAKDGSVQCVAVGDSAYSSIIWKNQFSSQVTSDFLFESEFPIKCQPFQNQNFCQWPWRNLGSWTVESSLDWDLPPVEYYRWEKLPVWATSGADTPEGRLALPPERWNLGVSVRATGNAQVFLCEEGGDDRCYWLTANEIRGDGEEARTTVLRRCRGTPGYGEDACDGPRLTEHKGRLGVEGEWLHLRLVWDPRVGRLRVLYKDSDLVYQTILEYVDDSPLNVSYLTLRSREDTAEWRIHHYEVLALLSTRGGNTTLKTEYYRPLAETLCLSFYYVINPGHSLEVSLLTREGRRENRTLLGALKAQQDGGLGWRHARFAVRHPSFHAGNRVQYDIQLEVPGRYRTSRSGMAVAIDAVRECDPRGEVRVSELRKPRLDSDLECFLMDDPETRVRFRPAADRSVANATDVLCRRVHGDRPCDATVACDRRACGCVAGYTGPLCRDECDTRSGYGPGCAEACGHCREAGAGNLTRTCHHITGECATGRCVGDYKPPLCKEPAKKPNLFMFAKDGSVQCVAEGPGAKAAIVWTWLAASQSSSDFLFESSFPNECLKTQACNFCVWPWRNIGGWKVQTSLDWRLPPLDYFRWEKLPVLTTSGVGEAVGHLKLPASNWTVGVSAHVRNDAQIFLCDVTDVDCYQVLVNGLHEAGFVSWVRRSDGVLPNARPTDGNHAIQHRGRVGEESDWLHLRLDWREDAGELRVFYRTPDLGYRQFLHFTDDGRPIRIDHLAVRTNQQEGEWRLHNYEVLALLTTTASNSTVIKTDWYQPRAERHCISMFYFIYPGHALNVTLHVQEPGADRVVNMAVLTGSSSLDRQFKWRELQFTTHHPTFNGDNEVLYDFRVRGVIGRHDPADRLAAIIDSVRECDTRGDVRVSTIRNPGFLGDDTDFECYLSTDPATKVRLGPADLGEATSPDALEGGRLCTRVNLGQPCKNTVVCSHDVCACARGYLGPVCKEECGWGQHRYTYGPGCSEVCGNCTETRRNNTKICHHVDGRCFTNRCMGDLEPPLCKNRIREKPSSTPATPDGDRTTTMEVTVPVTVAGFVLAVVVLLLLVVVIVNKRRLEKKLRDELRLIFEGGAVDFNPQLPLYEQAELLPYSKRWEFPRDKLKLGERLGAGEFGVVVKGEAICIRAGETITPVAVKMVKHHAGLVHIKALASEMKIMAHLGKHLNIVNFLGACTKNLDKSESARPSGQVRLG